eukprot:GHVU01161822.1.p3 GENE.GHVU01161822.1~~GHVU01161822.1.p3  ORF type:complete len:111 (-),score=17.69 GHVU01161822.1:1750-2082(-)
MNQGINSAQLRKLLQAQTEWSDAAVIDGQGRVLAATCEVTSMDASKFVNALDERDVTIGRGLTIGGRRFEVHRIHPPLVYGRRGNPDDSEGIAVAHVCSNEIKERISNIK